MKIVNSLIFTLMSASLFAQTNAFIPLDSGNVWIFNNNPYIRIEIVGKSTYNNKTYSKLLNRAFYPETQYIRFDSNKVYQYDESINTEKIIYDLSVSAGTTFYSDSLGYFRQCTQNEFVQYLGRSMHLWSFGSGRNCIDCFNYVNLVDSLGWTESGGAFYTYRLSQVTIKGKSIITGVKEISEDNSKEIQCDVYPNPFNTSSVIRYVLPMAGHVDITLFNSLGQKVKSLFNAQSTKGHHFLNIDGSDLSSGSYFCQLNYSGQVITKQILLIK